MRSIIIPLLVLLFFMCGAHTQSTQTEVQTETKSTGAADVLVDVSTELRELRDIVVEMRVLLTVTQTEVETLKTKNFVQEIELAVLKTRLTASETEVVDLIKAKEAQGTEIVALKIANAVQDAELTAVKTRLAATEPEIANLKVEVAAQEIRLSASETEIANLKKDSAVQETRLSASETELENLKMETAAQEAELTAVKTRLADIETAVVNLEREITEKPKVAFSAFLTDSGYIEAGNTELNLVFTKIMTNVGQAYSNITGFFTAPVRGVYYFRFTVMDILTSHWIRIKMSKNGKQLMYLGEYETDGIQSYLSSGLTLQLEVGDVVNMRVPVGHRVYDSSSNHSIFSGFLLFPL